MTELEKTMREEFGHSLEEAGVTKDAIAKVTDAYHGAMAPMLANELAAYPASGLYDSPNELGAMIVEGNPQTDRADIKKYASRAYARMAEKILLDLRAWAHPFPETKNQIARLREYLKEGDHDLAYIGTSEKELARLTRELPWAQGEQ